MIDRVVILNVDEVLVIYTNRTPVKLYAKDDIKNFVMWFLSPRVVIRLDEYRRAIALSNQETSEINIEEVA